MRKIPFAEIELTSQRVRGLRGTSELPGRPAYGTLRISLRSEEDVVFVTLMNVAHIPGLSHHLLSLRRFADMGKKYIGTREGIGIVFAKAGDGPFAPSYVQLNYLYWLQH